jgi:hypothetical protein
VTIRTVFFEAQQLIGGRLQREPQERELLLCAASALFFISDRDFGLEKIPSSFQKDQE